jgi:uncharacterized protein UPF0175
MSSFTKSQRKSGVTCPRLFGTWSLGGRILLAVERYKKGEASLGRAAELAGLPLGQMITILTEFRVESRLEKEDYLQGIRNLHKVW